MFTKHLKIASILAAIALTTVQAHATLLDYLGAANKYTVLSLNGTTLNLSLVTIYGDTGTAAQGDFKLMGPSVIHGTAYVDPAATIATAAGKADGGIVRTPIQQAVTDALSASNTFAGFAPTKMFSSLSAATTITGNGGLNVISLTGGINLGGSNNLTLSGNANDQFVFNIQGGLQMDGSAAVVLTGGVRPENVVFNFIGAGSSLMTHVNNSVTGIVLAPQRDITFHGAFGEIIGGGSTLTLMSGATVIGFVPEVSSSSVMFGFLGLIVAVGSRRLLSARSARKSAETLS